jgi:hypothetical protein
VSEFTLDVFVSYNSVNKPWVRQRIKQWRAFGIRVFFDEDGIDRGEDVLDGIERERAGSRMSFYSFRPVRCQWLVAVETISL